MSRVMPRSMRIRSREAAALRFRKSAAKPRISKILKTFEPRTLPTAMSDSFLSDAMIETTSSGRDVPTATRVKAMTRGSIPKKWAKMTADSISRYAPPTTPAIPKTINNKFLVISLFSQAMPLTRSFFAQVKKMYIHTAKLIRNRIPPITWYLSNMPKYEAPSNSKVAARTTMSSRETTCFFTSIGLMSALKPRTSKRLATHEPIMFPSDISAEYGSF